MRSFCGPRNTFIHEAERVPPLHVSIVELLDEESRRNEVIDLAVEMTATRTLNEAA
jgi:hypothetical protein